LAEAGVEGDDLENLDRLQLQLFCDPFDGLRRDETEPVLDDVEQRQDGGALALAVVGDAFFGLGIKLEAGRKGREILASRSLRRSGEVL